MEPVALVDDRQRWLLDQLVKQRRLITTDAAEQLGVSVDTIRRDLRALHHQGLLRRVHGGAVPASPLSASFTGRSAETEASRSALADAVLARLRPGQVIGLDAGSTNVEVAARLPHSLAITVITNSPAAAMALADHPSAGAILLGGAVDLTWMATTGPDVVDGWRNHHLDLAILGACGFDPLRGMTTRSPNEVSTKRALIEAGAEVVLPLQHQKLGGLAPFHVVDPDQVDVLIVDADAEGGSIEACREAGLEVITAG